MGSIIKQYQRFPPNVMFSCNYFLYYTLSTTIQINTVLQFPSPLKRFGALATPTFKLEIPKENHIILQKTSCSELKLSEIKFIMVFQNIGACPVVTRLLLYQANASILIDTMQTKASHGYYFIVHFNG